MNGQLSYHFVRFLTAEFGVDNILDRNYTIQEGYPEAGRNFYVAIYINLPEKLNDY